MGIKTVKNSIGQTLKKTFKIIYSYPSVFVPFYVLIFASLIPLLLIYFAYTPPVSFFMEPLITSLYGKRYFQYPSNLILCTQLNNLLSIPLILIVGIPILGTGVSMVQLAYNGEKPLFKPNFKYAVHKYWILLAVSLIMGLISIIIKVPQYLGILYLGRKYGPQSYWMVSSALNILNFILFLILTTLFAYTTQVIIIEGRKVWGTIKRAISVSRSIFLHTFVVVLLSKIIIFPLFMWEKMTRVTLQQSSFPERILIISGSTTMLSWLVSYLLIIVFTTSFLTFRPKSNL